MIRTSVVLVVCLFIALVAGAQFSSRLPADAWVDSVFKKLTPDEKIAQSPREGGGGCFSQRLPGGTWFIHIGYIARLPTWSRNAAAVDPPI